MMFTFMYGELIKKIHDIEATRKCQLREENCSAIKKLLPDLVDILLTEKSQQKKWMLHGSSNVMYLKMVKFAEELEEEKW